TKIHGVIERPVQLSIDAAEEHVAQRMLGVSRPQIDTMLKTFDNFMAFGIMPVVKAVITGLNYDQPLLLVERYYPRGARRFTFVRYHRSFYRHSDDLFVNEQHIPVLKAQFDTIRARYPDIDLKENLIGEAGEAGVLSPQRRQELWDTRMGCGGGWCALGIAPDGSAFLCEQMKLDEPFIVGDTRSQSIQEIWNGERMARFIYPAQEQFSGTICQSCNAFEQCMWEKGRCYRDAFFSYGSIYTAPPLCPKNPHPGLRLG
ncbi:MAG: SPASM domain-containing protein, partial [Oscillochloris sp.]|nr:SPASM domain-containing protein [Oscillochloris sp.]